MQTPASRPTAVLWLAALGCLAGCQGGPDYSTAGSVGPSFGDRQSLSAMERQDVVAGPLPAAGECGKVYAVIAQPEERNVDCGEYNYGLLYDIAEQMIAGRAREVECRDDKCPYKKVTPTYERGSCFGGNAGVASVVIRATIECSADQSLVEYTPLTGDALRKPFERFLGDDDVPNNEQIRLTLYPPPAKPGECPRKDMFGLERFDYVRTCADVTDFEPYVASVRRQLRRYHERLICPAGCPKKPIDPDTDELYIWDCALQMVHVRGYLETTCQGAQ